MSRSLQRSALAATLLAIFATGPIAVAQDGWQTLERVTHRRLLWFQERGDKPCFQAEIAKVSPTSIEVKRESPANKLVVIPRREVLWVGMAYVGFPAYALYSGRSSWHDVLWLPLMAGKTVVITTVDGRQQQGRVSVVTGRELKLITDSAPIGIEIMPDSVVAIKAKPDSKRDLRTEVTTKDGKKHTGFIAAVTPTELTLKEYASAVTLAKADVERIELMQDRPASAGLSYSAMELGPLLYLDPELWVYKIKNRSKLRVRIFDATLPEENSVLRCP